MFTRSECTHPGACSFRPRADRPGSVICRTERSYKRNQARKIGPMVRASPASAGSDHVRHVVMSPILRDRPTAHHIAVVAALWLTNEEPTILSIKELMNLTGRGRNTIAECMEIAENAGFFIRLDNKQGGGGPKWQNKGAWQAALPQTNEPD